MHTCLNCKIVSESYLKDCHSKQHTILSSRGVKRFFKCTKCSHGVTTLNRRYPANNCKRCEGYNFQKTGIGFGNVCQKGFNKEELVCAENLKTRGEEFAFSLKRDL